MGGTIAAMADDRMNLTHYGGKNKPLMAPAQWLHDLPELEPVANVTVEDVRPAPGSNDNFSDIAKVAHRLNELAHDPSIDGFVITHGPNTMAEVAYYIDFVVDTDKPIVFTGSQRPWSGISGDGPFNLLDAVRVAADPAVLCMGVLQVMNQNINTARDVTKTSAYRVQAFKGVDVGPIGVADSDIIRFYRAPHARIQPHPSFAGLIWRNCLT